MNPIQCIDLIRIGDDLIEPSVSSEASSANDKSEQKGYTLRLKEWQDLEIEIEHEVA